MLICVLSSAIKSRKPDGSSTLVKDNIKLMLFKRLYPQDHRHQCWPIASGGTLSIQREAEGVVRWVHQSEAVMSLFDIIMSDWGKPYNADHKCITIIIIECNYYAIMAVEAFDNFLRTSSTHVYPKKVNAVVHGAWRLSLSFISQILKLPLHAVSLAQYVDILFSSLLPSFCMAASSISMHVSIEELNLGCNWPYCRVGHNDHVGINEHAQRAAVQHRKWRHTYAASVLVRTCARCARVNTGEWSTFVHAHKSWRIGRALLNCDTRVLP